MNVVSTLHTEEYELPDRCDCGYDCNCANMGYVRGEGIEPFARSTAEFTEYVLDQMHVLERHTKTPEQAVSLAAQKQIVNNHLSAAHAELAVLESAFDGQVSIYEGRDGVIIDTASQLEDKLEDACKELWKASDDLGVLAQVPPQLEIAFEFRGFKEIDELWHMNSRTEAALQAIRDAHHAAAQMGCQRGFDRLEYQLLTRSLARVSGQLFDGSADFQAAEAKLRNVVNGFAVENKLPVRVFEHPVEQRYGTAATRHVEGYEVLDFAGIAQDAFEAVRKMEAESARFEGQNQYKAQQLLSAVIGSAHQLATRAEATEITPAKVLLAEKEMLQQAARIISNSAMLAKGLGEHPPLVADDFNEVYANRQQMVQDLARPAMSVGF